MIIKILTFRKPLYPGFVLVLIIKYSWTYGGGEVYFNIHRWGLPHIIPFAQSGCLYQTVKCTEAAESPLLQIMTGDQDTQAVRMRALVPLLPFLAMGPRPGLKIFKENETNRTCSEELQPPFKISHICPY